MNETIRRPSNSELPSASEAGRNAARPWQAAQPGEVVAELVAAVLRGEAELVGDRGPATRGGDGDVDTGESEWLAGHATEPVDTADVAAAGALRASW
jgi:hypothetical protein